jgi:hypothetical protein
MIYINLKPLSYYVFFEKVSFNKTCKIKFANSSLILSNSGSNSTPSRHSENSTESDWHMIIGGKNNEDLSSVELFNWRTGQQCWLKDIPIKVRIHAGTVFEGIPIICGGFSSEESIANCYKYSIQD